MRIHETVASNHVANNDAVMDALHNPDGESAAAALKAALPGMYSIYYSKMGHPSISVKSTWVSPGEMLYWTDSTWRFPSRNVEMTARQLQGMNRVKGIDSKKLDSPVNYPDDPDIGDPHDWD